ncbi:hypothetical protein [Rhizobium laguerreae]|uniref:hypothetical protein n=1 Tax=Rhizobium laguerreae TaxID=1076926 RepID=UPI001C900CCF|nr:hypothetical protein [Rhizobium laguerreae]MBY3314734.1 hypothetical protein [Rhizobium laguerreae]
MGIRAWIRQFAMKCVIAAALNKKAPAEFTTSGDEATNNDFYIVYLLDGEGVARLVVQKTQGSEVYGTWSLDGRNFTEDKTLTSSELSEFTLWIHHHYRTWVFYSVGVQKFLVNRLFCWPWIRVTLDHYLQARFNRKELTRQDRMKVLEHILGETIKDSEFQTQPTRLMTHLYSARWVHRTDKDELENYYTFILNALEQSGDLATTQQHGYKLTAKALNTVTFHAEDERRHNDNKKIQIRIVILTIALTVVGIVQAGAAAYEQWLKPPETFTGALGNQPINLIQQ